MSSNGSACTGSSETHAGNGLCLEAVEEIAARLSGFFFVRMFVCLWGFFKHLILSFLALIYFIFVLQNLTVMVLFPSSYSATNMFLADILLLRRIKPLKKIVLCFQKYVYLLSQGTDNYSSVLNTIYRAQGGLVVINSKFSNHQIG